MSALEADAARVLRVDVWADLICPWCWIGKRRFEAALAAFPHAAQVEVVPHAFRLAPGAPPRPSREVLPEKFGRSPEDVAAMMRQVEATAAEVGLEYHLLDALHGDTVDAHRLVAAAQAAGTGAAVVERLYRAHFTENRSLFDRDQLVALAAEVGFDAVSARAALDDPRTAEAVDADQAAMQQMGANGVPFFVLDGRYGVSGAQPAELFTQALQRAWDG